MTACQGNMFVLVNVDQHQHLIGPIIKQLVADYGTPVSIVDNIQKICPKCSRTPQTNPDSSSAATTTTLCSEEQHDEPTTPSPLPVVRNNVAPAKIGVQIVPNKIPKSEPNTAASKAVASCHQPTLIMKRKESPARDIVPEVKKLKMDVPVKIKNEEVTIDDDEDNVLGTVLAALQNRNSEVAFNGSGASSDDGASNSSHIYDVDEEDYNSAPWTNPDFLTNFITSQPNIFSATGQNTTRSQSKAFSQIGSGKRQVPPMLTVNGKTRRGRIVYSTQELNILEKYYEEDPNACADPKKRETMCKTLCIDYHRLKVWFQNRRRKDKVRSQEEAAASFNGQDQDYSPDL